MGWMRTVVREVWGLFVDDGSFALLIVVWVGFLALLVGWLGWRMGWVGAAMFGGLGLILGESVLRFARAKRT